MTKQTRIPKTLMKSAYEFAEGTGKPIAGIKFGPGPSVEILFVTPQANTADAALAAWQQSCDDG